MATQGQNKEYHLNDDMCHRALNRAHKKVIEEMEPEVVLDGLKKSGFLSQDEYQDLMNLITKPMKNRILVSKISQGGTKAYLDFKKCLGDTKQEHLVKELEEKEKEVIEESQRYHTLSDERLRRQKSEEIKRARMSGQDKGMTKEVNVDRIPSERELADIAHTIGNGWELFAAYLDISVATVDQIKADYQQQIERVYQLFQIWKRRKGYSATLRMLLKHMRDCTALVVDWEEMRSRVGFGIEVIDTINEDALKMIQDVLGVPFLQIQQPQQELPFAPALEGSAFNVFSREEMVTKVIKKDLHDGRLIELTKEMVDELKSPTVSDFNKKLRGAFGRVYVSRDEVPGFNLRLVLKEINLEQQAGNLTQKLGSITNEKIAARLMHFGIVPLLAYYDDHNNQKYYFASPYFENGDLFEAIKEDTNNVKRKLGVKMDWKTRVKIMYQVACAIDYMHTGNKFRGTILHMDIKSKNIVLDAKFNARLIDFGLARELKEGDETLLMTVSPIGTPGYFPTVQHSLLTKQHDYHNFGVVLLELITGLDPSATEEQIPLREWHQRLVLRKQQDLVWIVDGVVEEAVDIALSCIKSIRPHNTDLNATGLTSERITIKFKDMCRKNSVPKWEAIEGNKCQICLVNETLNVCFDGHDNDSESEYACSGRIRTCCSCMRNSYINPVKCHTCGNTIEPFINAKWGAVLVAGYDEDFGKVFLNDISTFQDVITSKFLPAMCLNSENVIVVPEQQNGQSIKKEIKTAFKKLFDNDIKTLLFVYSGHNSEDSGLQIGKNEFYPIDKLSDRLNKFKKEHQSFEKVIAILDCCVPKRMGLDTSVKFIQLNATGQDSEAFAFQSSPGCKNGSQFIQYINQVFTARANGGKCKYDKCNCMSNLDGDFIYLEDFIKCLKEHKNNGHLKGDEPQSNMQNLNITKDTILAYNYSFEVKFQFSVDWPGIPKRKTISVFPKDFNDFEDLKLHLASEVIKHVFDVQEINENHNEAKNKIAEIMVLEIYTGPKAKHIEEMRTQEQILLAWISKRLLRCTARRLNNIDKCKPVGQFLKNGRYVQAEDKKCNPKKPMAVHDLMKHKTQLEQIERQERKHFLNDYIDALDLVIHHTKDNLLKENCLDISFLDMVNEFTLVYMSLVPLTGVQETTNG